MHEDQVKRLAPHSMITYADIFLDKAISPEDKERVNTMLESIKAKTPDCTLTSFESAKEEMEESIGAIRSLGYGMILLISLIGGLNIINTTMTSLHTRCSELGTLRAIGMSSEQMKRLVMLESLHYGLRALVLGLPIGILLSAVTSMMTRGLDRWQPPVLPVLSAAAFAVRLCLLAAWPPLVSMKKMNIVESIGRTD